MSLEGNLRDIALPEICQLLAHTRKTGELRLKAPLAGLSAHILFDSGAIIGADIAGLAVPAHLEADVAAPDAAQVVERTALELLCWNEGEFRFLPQTSDTGVLRTGVRLHTELLLMEGARRSVEWLRLSDRIPNARAVPAFVDVEPRQLPLLNLDPQQWEVLTGVDGQRDLPALARSLGRDILEVAETVHTLIGTGLLKLVELSRAQRTQATPPSIAAQPEDARADLWVPGIHEAGTEEAGDDYDDEIFDPVRIGVITPEGLPRFRTPLQVARVAVPTVCAERTWMAGADSERLRERGDAAARRGDLTEAMRCWNEILDDTIARDATPAEGLRATRMYAQQAVAAAARLHELLQAHQAVS